MNKHTDQFEKKVEPIQLLTESLREQCLWHSLNTDMKDKWFIFMQAKLDKCVKPKVKNNNVEYMGAWCDSDERKKL